MTVQSFDAAHAGACPGCGVFDNGNHIVHRYDLANLCPHRYHAYNECTDPKVIKRQLAKQARFFKWIHKELGQ